MPTREEPIRSPGLLLCEGSDDFAFFLSMLQFLRIPEAVIWVERLDGRPQLHDRLNGLSIRDRRRALRALGIVCDADDPDDGLAAFVRIKDSLRATGFMAPGAPTDLVRGPWGGGPSLSVGVFIMPDNQVTGALEDLCLAALAGDPSLPCVDDFLTCVSTADQISRRQQDRSKARLNSWLASRSDPTLRLGQAMSANVIDRGHAAFGPIRDFLIQLSSAAGEPETP